MSDVAGTDAEAREPWHSRVPARTMAIWLALVVIVFLTRNRWEVWVVEWELPPPADHFREAAMTPDGRRLVVYGWNYVCLWDMERGRTLATYRGGTMLDVPIAVSPDGRHVVIAAGLMLPRMKDGDKRSHPGTSDTHVKLCSSEPLVVEAETGRTRFVLRGHAEHVFMVAYSPEGARMVTASFDGTARVWDAETGAPLLVLRPGRGGVREAWFSSDGERVFASGGNGVAVSWDSRTGKELGVLGARGGKRESGEFILDARRVLVWNRGTDEHTLWDSEKRTVLAELGRAWYHHLLRDGRALATFHRLGLRARKPVRIWETGSGRLTTELEVYCLPRAAAFSPDCRQLAVCDYAGTVDVHDLGTGEKLYSLPDLAGDDGVQRAEFTPDGGRIVTTKGNGTWVWDGSTGVLLAAIADTSDPRLLDNARMIATRPSDGASRIIRRLRPEWWWGVFYLWHLWVIAALAVALALSAWKDARDLRRRP